MRPTLAECFISGGQIPIDNGQKLLVVVGSVADAEDINIALFNMKVDVRVAHINYLLPDLKLPETGPAYQADVRNRVQAASNAWMAIPKHERDTELLRRNLFPENVYFLARRSGFIFAELNLWSEPEFTKVFNQHVHRDLKKKLNERMFPGREFPDIYAEAVIEACGGSTNFFQKVAAICERREAEGVMVYGDVEHWSYAAVTSMADSQQIFMENGHELGTWVKTPRPKVPTAGSLDVSAAHYFVSDLENSYPTEAQQGRKVADYKGSDGQVLLKALRRIGIRPGKSTVAAQIQLPGLSRMVSQIERASAKQFTA